MRTFLAHCKRLLHISRQRRLPAVIALSLATALVLYAHYAGLVFAPESPAPSPRQVEKPAAEQTTPAEYQLRKTMPREHASHQKDAFYQEHAQYQKDAPYEEALGSPLEKRVKQVDHAILEGLILAGLPPSLLRIDDVGPAPQPVPNGAANMHFQRIVIRKATPPQGFREFLTEELALLDSQAKLEQRSPTVWHISLMQRPTHELLFQPPREEPVPAPLPAAAQGLVLIMDDLGLDARVARDLAALPEQVTFSVLPDLPHTDEVIRIARENGRELLLHQPMEPLDGSISPGPGALYVDMPREHVAALVAQNLAKVPGAVGLNNHMGSRFTQHAPGVDAVLRTAADKGVFVIDSITHPGSLLARRARQLGVPVLKRDIFLDVVKNPEAILHQLRKAERLAARRGSAVAIGHPYPETLQALKRWSKERTQRHELVRVVSARALLRSQQARMARKNEQPPLAQKSISR